MAARVDPTSRTPQRGTNPASRPVVLVIPPEIRASINKYSGFINPKSQYADRPLKGLFKCPANVKYLTVEIYKTITNPGFVSKHLPDDSNDPQDSVSVNFRSGSDTRAMRNPSSSTSVFGNRSGNVRALRVSQLVTNFKRSLSLLRDLVPNMVDDFVFPYSEDLPMANPVIQLHHTNRDFVLKSCQNFVQTPDTLWAQANDVNPDTGLVEVGESDYSPASYSDGSWHPEHLFTNKARNRHNDYWTPIEVNYKTNPTSVAERGPGHRYMSNAYHNNYEGNGRYQNEQFPRWQYSVSDRPIDRDYVEISQAQNGVQDRRVQGTRGFDMTALMKRSTV